MAALGRTVRQLGALRVLACDVDCPPDHPRSWREPYWPPLLSALRCCPALESLSLPGLCLASPAQARRLAASLPRLTDLELCSLPPAAARRTATTMLPGLLAGDGLADARSSPGGGGGDRGSRGERLPERVRREARERAAAAALLEDLRPCYLGDAAVAALADGVQTPDKEAEGGGRGRSGGCLAAFGRLRRLALRRTSVAQLAQHALPLPPGLRELRAPLAAESGRSASERLEEHLPLSPVDLLLLHARLLPALGRPAAAPAASAAPAAAPAAPGRTLALAPGPCVRSHAPLLCGMLVAWVGGCVTELDLRPQTHPGHVGAPELAECLRRVAQGMPQLRRLRCHLWAARASLFPPAAPPSSPLNALDTPFLHTSSSPQMPYGEDHGGRRLGSAAALPRLCGTGAGWGRSKSRSGTDADAGAGGDGDGDAGGVPVVLVDSINAMTRLEELEVQVMAVADWAVPPLSSCIACPAAYRPHRVPLGLLAALRRPLRVVDCSPLECWCCPDDGGETPSSDPRVALSAARAALAASGCRCRLVAEAEEWAAGAMGLGPEREAVWRKEAVLG